MNSGGAMLAPVAGDAPPRKPGSSCQALRLAVAALNRLDDFNCDKIGSGFFSEVFKVTHRTTGQVMVLKMNLLRSNRPNMLKEVQLMNQLSHNNILGFKGVCVHEGQLHALTEYINGGSLEQLIQNRSQELPHLTRMKLAADIARGMEYLHSRGIFHRDLTSKNVLIKKSDSGEMTAVVGDFGLAAKIPDRQSGYRLPTVGSPYWMSPECLKGQFYDEHSDVFSYGIILCELLARVEADPDILPRTENFGLDYLAFTELCGPCPPEFLKLAFHCCTFEPRSRPSFSEIVKALEKMIADYERAMNSVLPTLEKAHPSGIAARSEELIPSTTSYTQDIKTKKQCHRRSLSEEVGVVMFPPRTAPSDKARCHVLLQRHSPPPLLMNPKHVGECMSKRDPHYKPAGDRSNPFASLSQFRGVKKILGGLNKGVVLGHSGDLFSSCCELPSPYYGPTPPSTPTGDSMHDAIQDSPGLEEGSEAEWSRSSPVYPVSLRGSSQALSLPTSPVLARRKEFPTGSESPAGTKPTPGSKCTGSVKKASSLFAHPLFRYSEAGSGRHPLRVCSSSLSLAEDPGGGLRRHGSCESGFFSSVGEDFPVDPPRHDTSTATLSSSSAASSLFLLDDAATPVCEEPARPHHPLLFVAKRSSSIYTDSSEDVSSVGAGDLAHWEERSLGQPQQISKVVEYFERMGTSLRHHVDLARHMEGTTLDDAIRSSRIALLRKKLEKVSVGVPGQGRAVPVVVQSEGPSQPAPRRSNSQRLMICEGAVKSKLPLFDRK